MKDFFGGAMKLGDGLNSDSACTLEIKLGYVGICPLRIY
jgi:hypothetical protein